MKYYAHYCKWGCNAVHADDGERYWGDYFAFSSKKARDEWVTRYEWEDIKKVARTCTRAEVVKQLGKEFSLVEIDKELEYKPYRADAEYLVEADAFIPLH